MADKEMAKVRERPRSEESLRRYLLGVTDESEQEHIERSFLNDPALFELLLEMEENLIEDYVHGSLNELEHRQFEAYFMAAPERRESVAFAKTLRRRLREVPRRPAHRSADRLKRLWRSPGPTLPLRRRIAIAFVCLTLLLAVIGTVLLVQMVQLRNQIEHATRELGNATRTQAGLVQLLEEERARSSKLMQERETSQATITQQRRQITQLESERDSRRKGDDRVVWLSLTPGLERDGTRRGQAVVAAQTSRFGIKLQVLDDSYQTFHADILTAEGQIITRRDSLRLRSTGLMKAVSFVLPAGALPNGDYVVLLSGKPNAGPVERVHSYYFRLVSR